MEFVAFWTDMSWIVILLVALTLIFALIEGFIPGFGICGGISILLGASSVIVEGILTKSLFNALFMLLLVLVVMIIGFAIFVHSAKKGILSKTPLIESGSALPKDYVIDNEKIEIIGKIGVIISVCKPVGKAEISGKEWTVIAQRENIPLGRVVEAVQIKNNVLIVKEIKGGKND